MDAHKNFALSSLATPPSGTSGTSLVVATGQGALFPEAPFNVTVWPNGVSPTAANAEIMRVTAKVTDTFTVTRAQESTSAKTFTPNSQIAATITAKTLTDAEYGAHGILNVMDPAFGAVGDGVTDDTEAFNRAIDAGAGKVIIAPRPSVAWYFAGTVAMDQVGVTLRFEGGDITFASGARILITADGCAVDGMGDDTHFDASANATTNAPLRSEANWSRFSDFKVTGSRGVGGGAASNVSAGGSSKTNLLVERVHSVAAGSHGVSLSRAGATIRDCVIATANLSGIFCASGCSNVSAERNTITQPNRSSTVGQGGIAVQGNTSVDGYDSGFFFTDNVISGALGNCIIVNNGTSTGQTRTGNVIIRGGEQVDMEGDNQPAGTEGEAVSASCDYLTVEGVFFRGAWDEAVNFTAAGTQAFRGFTCRGCTIEDCTLEPSGVVQSNGCGIEVNALDTASVSGFVIEGNTIIDTRGLSAATLGGVSVRQGDAGASLINGVVRNNTAIGMVNDTVLMVESAGANLEALNDLMQAGFPDRARQPMAFPIMMAQTSAWANQPAALTELNGSTIRRVKMDLSRYRQMRLVAAIQTAGATNAQLRVQYSTDNNTYDYPDGATGPAVALAATGIVAGAWVTLEAAAIADVFLRIVGIDGDAAASPLVNTLTIELR